MTKRKGKRVRRQVTVKSEPVSATVQSTYVAPRDEFAERVIWLATFFEKVFRLK